MKHGSILDGNILCSRVSSQWQSTADPEDVEREIKNARIASQVHPIPDDLLEELRTQGIVIYVAPSRTSFILGDEMGASAFISSKLGAPGMHRVHFMPLAPDVAVGYCTTRGVHIDPLEARDVRRMNEAMAKQSYLIAGRSRAQIVSLSRIPYDPPDMLEGWFKSGDTKSD